MSSIDERIVELQFNNGQFEQGVATSLGTLEKLKKGLNLEASANSLKGLNAAGKSFSLANVANNVQTVADRFSALGIIGDQVLRRITDGALRFGKSLLTAVPNQIIQGGKRRAQNIKHAQFMLEGLLKDDFDWDKISEDISFAVNETAYGFDEAAKVASQLAASNVAFGDDMKHALRAVSGVASMTGDSYENIGRIFAQVAGQGRLMGDQLLQISQRGLNAAAILGEAMGKSEAEVREMTSKGEVDFKTFAEAMYNAFGEQATRAEETFDGALSNVKASLSRMGAQFATPAYEEIRKVLLAVKEVFKTIEKLIKPISDKFAIFAQQASGFAIGVLGQLNGFLQTFVKTEEKVSNLRKNMTKLSDAFGQGRENLINMFSRKKDDGGFIGQMTDRLTTFFSGFKKGEKDVDNVSGSIEKLGLKMKTNLANAVESGQLKGWISNPAIKFGGKAAETVFNKMSDVSKSLKSNGIEWGQEMRHALQNITGIASKTNASYKDVGRVFTTISEQGKLTSRELKSFSAMGVDAVGILAKEFGVTGSDIHDMTRRGLIDFKSFSDAMVKTFGPHAAGYVAIEKQKGAFAKLLSLNKSAIDDTTIQGKIMKHVTDLYSDNIGKVAEFFGLNLETNKSLEDGILKTEELETIANKVINGAYGNGEERKKALTEEYGGWALIQNKVNELLGCEVRHEANQAEINRFTKENTKETEKQIEKQKQSKTILDGLAATLNGLLAVFNMLRSAGAAIWNNLISPFVQWAVPKIVAGLLSITGLIGDKLVKLETKLSQSDFFNKKTQQLATFFSTTKDKVVEFGKKVGSLPGVERLGKAMQNLIAFAKDLGSKAAKAISGFFSQFSGKKLGIGDSLLSFIDSASNKLSNFIDMITGKKTKVGFKESLFGKADKTIEKFHKGLDKLSGKTSVLDTIIKLFGNFKKIKLPQLDFKSMFGNLGSAKNKIAKLFKGIIPDTKAISKFFKGFNLEKIIKTASSAGIILAAVQLARFFKSISDGANGLAKVPIKFVKTLNEINSGLKATKVNLHSETILNIAEAIGILALSVVGLSLIPADALENAVTNLGVVMAMFGVLLVIVSKITAKSDAVQELDPISKMINDFLTGMKAAFAKAAKLVGMGTLILSIAAAIGVVVNTLTKLASGKTNWNALEKAGRTLALVLTGLTAAAVILSKYASGFSASTGAGLLMFAESLKVVVAVMGIIGNMGDMALIKGGVVVAALALMMSALAKYTGGNDMVKFGAGCALFAAALYLLIPAIVAFAALPFMAFLEGAADIGILLLVLTGISKIASGCISGAASLFIMAGAILVLAPAIIALGAASDKAWEGIRALAVGLSLLLLAAAGAEFLTAGLTALTTAVAALAGSFVTFSAGMLLFGAGIVVVTAAIDFLLSALPGIGGKLINVIGLILKGIGVLFVKLLVGIKDAVVAIGDWLATGGAAALGKGVIDLLVGLLKIIGAVFIQLPWYLGWYAGQALAELIKVIVTGIRDAGPKIADAIANLWDHIQLSWFQMMASNAADGGVVGTIMQMLGVDFDEEAAKVEAKIAARKKKAEEAGKTYTNGMKNGIESGSSNAANAMTFGARSIEDAAKTLNLPPDSMIAQFINYYTKGSNTASKGGESTEKIVKLKGGNIKKAAEDVDISSEPLTAGIEAVFKDGAKAAEEEAPKTVKAVEKGIEAVNKAVSFANKQKGEKNEYGSAGVQGLFNNMDKDLDKTGPKIERKIFGIARVINAGIKNSMEKVEMPESSAEEVAGNWFHKLGEEVDSQSKDVGDRLIGSFQSNLDLGGLTEYLNNGGVNIGGGLMDGLTEGTNDYSGLLTNLSTAASESTNQMMSDYGEHSPSTVFAAIGKNLMLGLANGVAQNQGPVKTAVTMVALASIATLQRYQGQFMAAGKTSGGAYALGVLAKRSAAHSAGSSLASSAKSGASGTSLYSTGVSIGEGLVKGIRSKISSARKAGYDLGKAGAEGANAGGQVKSPSRITIKTGKYIGEGLIVGMKKVTSSVVTAGNSLGATTANSLRNPLSIVSDILGADFDVDPTITPVLDLSNIQNGARSIGGILSGYSVNAGLINASMNGRVQVSNADVVSAINDLSTRVENLPKGDSYTVGAITYDDGTNIATAVRQLAAAARVQRRA